jgi:SOS-response transcriptional repressor LexA
MAPKLEPGMSDKQLEVFQHIIKHIQDHGYQPSVAEMAIHFEVTKRAILDRLKLLQEKGFIRQTGKDRAIDLPHVRFQATATKRPI